MEANNDNVERLVKLEQYHRKMAESFDKKSQFHWNEANRILLEIQYYGEEIELQNNQ